MPFEKRIVKHSHKRLKLQRIYDKANRDSKSHIMHAL